MTGKPIAQHPQIMEGNRAKTVALGKLSVTMAAIALAGSAAAALIVYNGIIEDDDAIISMKQAETGNVAILTSLPLFTPESVSVEDAIGANGGASAQHPLGEYWRLSFSPTIFDDPDAALATKPDLLILAQPRPFSPAHLAAFDQWIRQGGRALVFADPALFWPSIFPIGDKRRPEGATLLSPLFRHWGLEQRIDDDQPEGAWSLEGQKPEIVVVQSGYFVHAQSNAHTDTDMAACELRHQAMVAICSVGKGKAVLVADADMLQADFYGDLFSENDASLPVTLPETGNWRGVDALLDLARD